MDSRRSQISRIFSVKPAVRARSSGMMRANVKVELTPQISHVPAPLCRRDRRSGETSFGNRLNVRELSSGIIAAIIAL